MLPFPPALRWCCSLLLQPRSAVTVVPKRRSWCLWNAARKPWILQHALLCSQCSLDTQLAQLAYEFLWVISIILLYRPQLPSPLTIKLVQPWEVWGAFYCDHTLLWIKSRYIFWGRVQIECWQEVLFFFFFENPKIVFWKRVLFRNMC